MSFETDNPVIKIFDFLKNVGTLYDLLINLLNKNENILDFSAMQIYLAKIISKLEITISENIQNITDKSQKPKKEVFAAQSGVLTNLNELVEKKTI